MATTQEVQQLYIGLLGRAADQAGLQFWIDDIASGNRTLSDVQAAFAASPEFAATYGGLTDRTDLVTAIYTNLFERAPDAEGLAYWVGTSLTADQLIAGFLQYASPADKLVIDNKVTVAETYTKVAGGADFNKAAAADVISAVDGTLASVAAALNKLANGQLDGQVPGAAQLQAQAAAAAALSAYEKQAAADATTKALIDKFTAIPGPVASTDGLITKTEAAAALTAANTARSNVSVDSTAVLTAKAADATAAAAAALNALDVTGKTLANKWIAAVGAAEAAKAADVTAVAGVKAALDADTTFTTSGLDAADAVITGQTFADATALYTFYIAATTTDAQRTTIDTAFANVATFASFKATAVIDVADKKADAAVGTATTNLGGATGGNAFMIAAGAKQAADKKVSDAQAADKAVADVKAVADKFAALDKAVTDAGIALGNALTAANANLVDLGAKAAGAPALTAGAAKSDVFTFATAIDTDDFNITGFGQGTSGFDYLVLGQGYTFNNGALSTGNNSVLEFFLVQNGADTQVVIETEAYGNASSTVNATTGAVTASPDAAVITLTGVTLDHLQVSNGVISYVA